MLSMLFTVIGLLTLVCFRTLIVLHALHSHLQQPYLWPPFTLPQVVIRELNVLVFGSDIFYIFHRDTYRCARSSDWGDRLPVVLAEDEDDVTVQSDNEPS